ncbi:MAG: hypothetical protein E7172_04165 [Firmicutes bacterium]|nr:hypothetical protein [Bacillota bacterium]
MINDKKDIDDEEFEKILLPFFNNYSEYIIKFLMPDAIAFYIANGYFRQCLSDCSLMNHINSAADVFNIRYKKEELLPVVEEILKVKYNLIISKTSPLKLKKRI